MATDAAASTPGLPDNRTANPVNAPAIVVPHKALLTVGVMLATMMQVLDSTIANVAIPHMQTSLGATLDEVTWVLTSYIIASAIAIPVTGWLADRIGSRQLFIGATAGFVLTSMLCGAATSVEAMVLFRIFQGICGAFMGPLSQTVMLDINPPDKQVKAMAIWGMGVMVGPVLGPIIGGWLTESYSWRWVFYVNLPIGIICLAMLWWLLPNRPTIRRRLDLTGFAYLAIALGALQLVLDRGSDQGWFDSWEIRIEALVCIAATWVAGVHLATARNPLFDRELLTNGNMLIAAFFMVMLGMIMMSVMALMPPLLQRIYGFPVLDTGILLAPRGLGIIFSMYLGSKLIVRFDARLVIAVGMAITAYSLWRMTHWSLALDTWEIIESGLIQGLGVGLVFVPLNAIGFATLPSRLRPDGASVINLARNIGASVGISAVTAMLARNVQVAHQDMAGHVTSFTIPGIDPIAIERFGAAGGAIMAMVDSEINRQAIMIAYLDDFYMIMFPILLTIPLVLLMKRPKVAGPVPHAVID